MSWTCAKCGHTVEQDDPVILKFCQRCGAKAREDTRPDIVVDPEAEVRAAGLDGRLRLLMIIFSGLWLVMFFIPFGSTGYGESIMSWDLLSDREGMAHLVAWPLVMALIFLVLGLVSPLPAWLRHSAAVLLGTVTLGIVAGSSIGGPFAQDLEFLFAGGAPWMLMFVAVGVGLLLRAHAPTSVGARVVIGLGLVLGLVAYLGEAMGGPTLVGSLLYDLGQDGVAQAITRVLMLLPLFVLLIAFVGFRGADEKGDPVGGWCKAVGLGLLIYLPAVMLLYGLMLSVDHETIWYFLMYLKLACYTVGFMITVGVGAAWCLDFSARHLLPRLTR